MPAELGVSGLLATLDEQDVRYVVLRWFDDLPHVDDGEDLDVLVSDEDAPRLDALVPSLPLGGGIPCDAYSVTGLPTFGWHGTAYYPPRVAQQILDGAIRHRSGARVPSPADHFRSLAFHALYHKGYRSGLPVSDVEPPRDGDPEHPYTEVLHRLASRIGTDVPITMRDLDRHLAAEGWRPPLDTLLKWGEGNRWCQELHAAGLSATVAPPGLCVFVVRARAGDPSSVRHIREEAERVGFRTVAVRRLDPDATARARAELRGANWGRGPHPRSGGDPHTALVLVDPSPSPPTASERAEHPGLDNGRTRAVKLAVRDWWNGPVDPDERCNVLHTSDSAGQAAHYLDVLFGAGAAALLDDAAAIAAVGEVPSS